MTIPASATMSVTLRPDTYRLKTCIASSVCLTSSCRVVQYQPKQLRGIERRDRLVDGGLGGDAGADHEQRLVDEWAQNPHVCERQHGRRIYDDAVELIAQR